MKKIITIGIVSVLGFAFAAHAAKKYIIEVSHDDELFVIEGEVYKAKTYCFNVEKGDQVIFTEGTPGMCVSAEFVNLRTSKKCGVWCE